MTDVTPAAPDPAAQALAQKAARLARSEGHQDWGSLPKETRLEYRRRVEADAAPTDPGESSTPS